MKKLLIPIGLIGVITLSSGSCDVLSEAADIATGVLLDDDSSSESNGLTNEEVIGGLKEALNVGIQNSVDLTSVTDGFLGNAAIRLPFPADAIKVKEKAIQWGLQGQVDTFEETLNRAAEEATKEALPIFKDAILGMSIQDGFAILNGGDGSATKFLQDNTTSALMSAFAPKVDAAISKVELTKYWNPIITKYNTAMTLTGGEKLNPDLSEYVTERAIIGLFHMVEQEENKIRKDPIARITDLLKKVFGSLVN
ncbi:MAG: DUF4197 domain-containing protein [Crocinitomicaceae bacterium]|nr:DUF4197 domain-containing protein [Crocinitomicaceae bacterium]